MLAGCYEGNVPCCRTLRQCRADLPVWQRAIQAKDSAADHADFLFVISDLERVSRTSPLTRFQISGISEGIAVLSGSARASDAWHSSLSTLPIRSSNLTSSVSLISPTHAKAETTLMVPRDRAMQEGFQSAGDHPQDLFPTYQAGASAGAERSTSLVSSGRRSLSAVRCSSSPFCTTAG